MPSTTKVPVGVTSLAGYSTSVVTAAGAVAGWLTGDHSRDNLVVILLGAYSALSLAVTQVGRYLQAKELAKKAPVVVAPAHPHPLVEAEITPTDSTVGPDEDLDPEPPEGPNPSAAREVLDRTGR